MTETAQSSQASTTDDTAPFRADHVGSLLRPPELLAAREQHAAGTLDAAGLRAVEDAAITDVVALQESVGLRSATDGEFRRTSWHMDFIYALGGITKTDGRVEVKMRNSAGQNNFTSAGMAVDGRVHLAEPIFATAFDYLASQVTAATPKLTIPSPSMVYARGGRAVIDQDVYPGNDGIEAFWADLSAAYADQLTAVYQRGCRYLQLDDTALAYLNDPNHRAELAEKGDDPETQHLRYIRQINAAIADRPADLKITTHMCRGNYRSSWAAEGGYDHVAEALFGELAVDGFFCEFDDERSGGFEPLRFVPPGKKVVLGLVTTKSGDLEDAGELKQRIEQAAKYVPLEQLCLSPQCGFSSTVEGNALTVDDQKRKLELIVSVAEDVWGR
ncbi:MULTISPECIES: 5-methyltetrahydropteroyltriglutamate--homocysteine S-methyltransferase [Pseudonocardia]|uniref:5-methyltetrahydropteroyltriglutamate--homocysteine methyltransferase n=2 Tax=Pseudonocardia TaxID=1847 RepID=A0A1Y2MUA1_PSEAH|nr:MULTISPECIES: 5-methyltetrahydropteroyltriglutamate--homocysteine S-methyltransferase [Pseudonocardia]OSY38721.1 5-methyltetrahydropteroyltriglutamate--homocysteine methyltransferase [Pseudonocardia autotrophica]TDN74923.1 5-methyltetrahydropteroyltriglutamate--homocysteine methyltransferase [Pseudonocardia autotrophica]BBF98862.1 5-methyltetrahydropteroyltriglutamate--homocysteine S-methyltransferase [Pseudonocardia autotrophica]GEC27858.1 5-methyltetrahydropteroyltriglutamate--homocystei n